MKNIILVAGIVIFSLAIGALVIFIPAQLKQKQLAQALIDSQTKSKSLQEKLTDEQKKASKQILAAKEPSPIPTGIAATVSLTKAPGEKEAVYFTYTKTALSKEDVRIDIFLKGDDTLQIDAVDLVATYSPTLTIKEIIKGDAFPPYPRSSDVKNTLTITGIALPQGTGFTYGKPNALFATLIIEEGKKGTITLSPSDTQAYFNAVSILDVANSFKIIEL